MAQRVLPLVTIVLFQAAVAAAQGPPCPEFRVNVATTLDQGPAAIATDAGGRFVVAWNSDHLRGYPDFDIFARRFDASGAPLGPEFQVNTFTPSVQAYPSVASAPGGAFVVVWDGFGAEDTTVGVFGQRFDASGVAQGPQFLVNTTTSSYQYGSSVAMDANAGFVVAWSSYLQDGAASGIFAQRFNATGVPQGPEFQVNTYTTDYQFEPAVAVAPTGEFVVVWTSIGQDGNGNGVFGQRYDAAGDPQGAEFRVHTFTALSQSQPAVAFGRNGDFLVTWRSFAQDGDGGGIFAQRYNGAGVSQGTEFQVHVQTTAEQSAPSVVGDSAGGFVVLWSSGTTGPGGNTEILGRRFSATGVPQGGEFQVNSYTAGRQFLPQVAAQPNRGFAAAWVSDVQDGSLFGVYGSVECGRLYPVTPCRLVDTRNPPGPTGGPPLAANSARTFPITGACGIPPDATDLGNLRLFPAGQPVPLASSLNFVPGRTRANNAIVPLGAGGAVTVQCDMPAGSTGTAHLVLDVFGYFKR